MGQFQSLTRRRILAGAAFAAAAGLVDAPAFAKAPLTNRPAPGFYRIKLGAFEVTVISDGPLTLGPPAAGVFKDVSKEEIAQLLSTNFWPTDQIELQQNTLVVNTGRNLVLFDTGTGKTAKAFGPNAGHQLENLKVSGIDPKSIDTVVITHAHPDHCFGIMSATAQRNFPNAQIYIAQADLEFWTDEAKSAMGNMMKMMIVGARQQLLPNRDRIVFFKDGQEVVPGIQAMAAPGHTVGHTVFVITSQGKTLVNAADIAHLSLLTFERPDVEFSFDTDGKQAVASRMRVFDMIASGRLPFLAYHFPWPGIGYIGKDGGKYRYVAETMRTVL